MNNWGGNKKKRDKTPVYFPVFDSLLGGIKKGEQLECRQQGTEKKRRKSNGPQEYEHEQVILPEDIYV